MKQYETKLDSYALGVMAVQLLCEPALAIPPGVSDPLRGSWRRLLTAWSVFREEVSKWHRQVHEVFARGGDMKLLYQQLVQDQLPERMQRHISTLCCNLRSCIDRTEDPVLQRLLWVIAELVDENSVVDFSTCLRLIGDISDLPLFATQLPVNVPEPSNQSTCLTQRVSSLPQWPMVPSQPFVNHTAAVQPSRVQLSAIRVSSPVVRSVQPAACLGTKSVPMRLTRSRVSQRSLSPPRFGATLIALSVPTSSPRLACRV